MDLTRRLVKYIMGVKYEDLNAETVEITKKLFLDTLGTTIAGSSAEKSKTLVDLVKGWGGKEESTVLIYGGRVPAHHAALVNCTMARALDLDDVHETGGGHLSATFMPVSLLLAEYMQRPVSGRELILAIAMGSDLAIRIRCALTTYPGWLAETIAPLGVVAMGGKLLGFDEERLINGMGLAYSQCSGNLQANLDGALTVRLQQGIGAKAGVLATVFAERGFTGAKDVFEGLYGFYNLYGQGKYNADVITDQLGKRFEIVNNSIKPYPCCKYTHMPIYGTLELLKEHRLAPEEISKIMIFTNSNGYNVTVVGDYKYQLRNIVDAQFSIPYTVAAAAIRGKVFIDDFTEASIRDRKVLEFAQKVKAEIDPELDKIPQMISPTRIELETRGGGHYSKYVEYVKGHPKNPMTMAEVTEKFQNCLRFAAIPLRQEQITQLIRLVSNLEEVDDVRRLTQLLIA